MTHLEDLGQQVRILAKHPTSPPPMDLEILTMTVVGVLHLVQVHHSIVPLGPHLMTSIQRMEHVDLLL